MTVKKFAFAGVLLALLLLGVLPFWWGETAQPSVAARDADVTEESAPVSATAVLAGDEDADTREPIADVAALPPQVAGIALPFEFSVRIHATDSWDLPKSGVAVLLAPDGHDLNLTPKAGEDGVVTVRWRARRAWMDIVYGVDSGATRALRRARIVAGRTAEFALRSDGGSVQASGFGVMSFEVHSVGAAGKSFRIVPVSGPGKTPKLRIDDDGWAWFVTRSQQDVGIVSGSVGGILRGNTLRLEPSVFASVQLDIAPQIVLVDGAAVQFTKAEQGHVVGTVRDANGRPVGKTLVVVAGGLDGERHSNWEAETGDDGTFRIENVPAGPQFVRAGGGERGLARGTVVVVGDETVTWSGALDRGRELHGRLIDEDGRGLADWTVTAQAVIGGAPVVDRTTTDSDGRFAIPNVDDIVYDLSMTASGARGVTWTVAAFWPGAVNRPVVVPEAAVRDSRLSLRVPVEEGQSGVRRDVRLWRAGSDRCLETGVGPDGKVEFGNVAPGDYRLELGGLGLDWADAATFRLVAGVPLELGEISAPRATRVRLRTAAEKSFWLTRVRADVISDVFTGDVESEQALFVPPGEIAWGTSQDAAVRETVAPGVDHAIDLDRRP